MLGVCLHHLIVDGWSIALFVEELSAAYRALVSGEAFEAPPLRIHAADHAAWQIARMESGALDGDLAYWRGVFESAVPPVALPTDRPALDLLAWSGACDALTGGDRRQALWRLGVAAPIA